MECRDTRQALGVYLLGAIDPAERGLVDAHLSRCPACREELTALAGLPALLGRVPKMDAELLALDGAGRSGMDEPPPELLRSLLRQVSSRRKARRWRAVTAAAAAVIIAVGGGAALNRAFGTHSSAASPHVAFATNSVTHVSAVVDFSPAARGTGMRVKVSGIPVGETCNFWVLNAAGQRSRAGGWTIMSAYGQTPWYSASSLVTVSGVHGFEITAGHQLLVEIPAS
jgi:hypothetical protein